MHGVGIGVGTVFAGYRIVRVLGRGGMGTVYLAVHPRLPRQVALKLLNRELSDDPEVRGRFEREADVSAHLDHPGIVSVLDRGVEDGLMWISMQYVDGTDASVFRGSPLDPARAIGIVAQTAESLDYAHERGVLHRDVKPANILLTSARTGDRVVLTDFGIARLRGDARRLTRTGAFLATLAYASPEQLSGKEIDHRSDQYSLGCTLFTLLTGESPFPADNPGAVVAAHLTKPVPRVSTTLGHLPPEIDAVLIRALAKDPDERFDSCVEFAQSAAAALAGAVDLGVHRTAALAGATPGQTASPSAYAAPAPAYPRPGADAMPVGDAHQPTVVSTPRGLPGPPAGSAPPLRPHPGPDRRVSPAWRTLSVLLVVLAVLGVATVGAAGVYWKFIRPQRLAPIQPWGQHQGIALAYPGMIPTDPRGLGWRDARCAGAGTVVALAGDPVPLGQLICTQPDGVTIWYTKYSSSEDVGAYLARHTQRVAEREYSGIGDLVLFRPDDPAAPFTLATYGWIDPGPAVVLVEVSWPSHSFEETRTQWWDQAPL